MRHRVDISLQAKMMLRSIGEHLGTPKVSLSTLAEMCIQAAYDNLENGGSVFEDKLNPAQQKLDEIIYLLQQVLPEV